MTTQPAPAPDLIAAVEALLSEWETQSHIRTSLPTAARMFRAGLKRHLRSAAPSREAEGWDDVEAAWEALWDDMFGRNAPRTSLTRGVLDKHRPLIEAAIYADAVANHKWTDHRPADLALLRAAPSREAGLDAVERAYFDGYKNGLANEVDDWNAPDSVIEGFARDYAGNRAVLATSPVPAEKPK